MKKLVAMMVALCLLGSSVLAMAEAAVWPEDGLVLGSTGVKVVLPEGAVSTEITEDMKKEGAVASASASSADSAGGFTLIVNEAAGKPENLFEILVAEMENLAKLAGLQVATSNDVWMFAAAAYGDALYMRTGRAEIGGVTVDYVQGDTYKGSRFVFAGVQDVENTYYILCSLNPEFKQKMPDVLAEILQPVAEAAAEETP